MQSRRNLRLVGELEHGTSIIAPFADIREARSTENAIGADKVLQCDIAPSPRRMNDRTLEYNVTVKQVRQPAAVFGSDIFVQDSIAGGRKMILKAVQRHLWFVSILMVCAFAVGLVFRYLFDDPEQRSLAYYVRSGVHGVVLALVGWAAHVGFGALLQERFRRAPLLLELAARVGFMEIALTAAAILLQVALYGAVTTEWLADRLPLIVAIALFLSTLFGMLFELKRLVGGRVLKNFLLGTYHRPVVEDRIIMFLDLAGSTALAERMGELPLHELITRFFFDIDHAIVAHDGEVHAYVGDAVIVTWTLDNKVNNGACVRCFFAIEDAMAKQAARYKERFGVIPGFRASLHTGPVVASECGNTKRQIAYFGDAMNVSARLQEYCKMVGASLVISGSLLRNIDLPAGVEVQGWETVSLRGRETRVQVASVRRNAHVALNAKPTQSC